MSLSLHSAILGDYAERLLRRAGQTRAGVKVDTSVSAPSVSSLTDAIRPALRRIKRALWQNEVSFLYSLPDRESIPTPDALRFTGINSLRLPSDQSHDTELPSPYRDFRDAGDGGLLAFANERLVGWLWVRTGEYVEPIGCGIARVPEGVSVIRYVEVLPEERGKGYARSLLSEAATRLRGLGPIRTVAFVGAANISSRKAFDAAGYTNEGKVRFRRILGKPLPVTLPRVSRGAGS